MSETMYVKNILIFVTLMKSEYLCHRHRGRYMVRMNAVGYLSRTCKAISRFLIVWEKLKLNPYC